MSKSKPGIEFEKLAESIFKKLIRDDRFESVEHNVQLMGQDGLRQIDVLVKTKSIGMEFNTIIECKDYKRKLSIIYVDSFHSKLLDVNASKGILVSRNGFSTKAISKAKRLGITLCTADEASDPNWKLKVDIPIVLEEIQPVHFRFTGEFNTQEMINIPHENLPVINDIDLTKFVNDGWKNGSLPFKKTKKPQKVTIDSLSPPYYIKAENGVLVEMKNFEVTFSLEIRYYISNLNELKNTQILNNITSSSTTIFFDVNSITDLNFNPKIIPKTHLKNYKGLTLSIKILTDMDDDYKKVQFFKIN
ncbi:hypothetical protein BFR04_02610 [Gaetbulibacter sp. 4G1]|nr:restriction endonuclease [Gaetbulibacter sp. 4G1]PIA78447.1 hypothetical protein BFR04_02610 [Gaetbulibacter sp. 4G1]